MPRSLVIPPEIHQYDFTALARREPEARTCLRWLSLAHLQEGKPTEEVAPMFKVHEKTVVKWLRRFREGGLEGLGEQPGRGCRQRLAHGQEAWLVEAVEEAQAQRSGGRLTGEDIRKLLAERFGVRYTLMGCMSC